MTQAQRILWRALPALVIGLVTGGGALYVHHSMEVRLEVCRVARQQALDEVLRQREHVRAFEQGTLDGRIVHGEEPLAERFWPLAGVLKQPDPEGIELARTELSAEAAAWAIQVRREGIEVPEHLGFDEVDRQVFQAVEECRVRW